MRVAVFSDIHSNLEAYEAVLSAFKQEGVDEYYCGGDIVGYGADPSDCIDMTKRLGPHIVAGNHDWGAAGLTDTGNFSENAKAAVEWTAAALREADKEYLRALKLVYKNDFAMAHGSLNRPEDFEYIFSLSAAYKTFLLMEEEAVPVCFVGHSHAAGIFVEDGQGKVEYNTFPELKMEEGKRYIVNVGSVGQPRDFDPRAAYCIYDKEKKMIEIKRVKYDVASAQEKIIKAGLPRILADRLSVGK